MTLERKKLKLFLETYLPDFNDMKKVGFFAKGIRKTDYEKIAERYCSRLGYKSIYEYRLVCKGQSCDGKFCSRDHPLCTSYPLGKFHPKKWKPYEVPDEREFYFNETLTN